jgi:hypothetical protein
LVDALGILKDFGIYQTILPFLLIAAGTYAILTKYKPFGEQKYANAIIATVVGMVFISFARAVEFMNVLMPVMTIFLLLIVLAILIFTFVGIKGETIGKIFIDQPAISIILILVFILLAVTVYGTVFPDVMIFMQNPVLAQQLNMTPAGTSAMSPGWHGATFLMYQIMSTIMSPQILGLIAMMVVFAIAVYFITREK